MMFSSKRWSFSAVAVLAMTSGCGAHAIPAGTAATAFERPSEQRSARAADTTSILKRLTKDVVIGSTVDTRNGDKGPRSLYIVRCNCKGGRLGQDQLVLCNFDNKAGGAGDGTTIEALNPKPKSQPLRFAQSESIKGCDGAAVTSINAVYATGLTSGKIVQFSNNGVVVSTRKIGSAPFSDADVLPRQFFSPEYIFAGTMSGGIVNLSAGFHGNGKAVQVVKGFAVSKGSTETLAPSGLQYNKTIDTLYVVDGASDTIVALAPASELLGKNEITVEPDGKTFKCEFPQASCATLVKAGSPLQAPIASTLLPNGNLIVANTAGRANKLVELTPQGQVLATKIVDSSKTQGVFGLAAAGTNDANTVLFFTDANTNTVQELEP